MQAALRLEPELRLRPVALVDEPPAGGAGDSGGRGRPPGGIEPGLTSTQALARCRAVALKSRSRLQEQAATGLLLQRAYSFLPNIEATAEGVCTLDLRGLAGDDWEKWAGNIIDCLARLNSRAQIGIAQTPGLAWLAAKRARPFLRVADAEAFLAALPLAALEPPAPLLEILTAWGLHATGAFLALGRENIAERLGPEGVELFDFAASRDSRPLKLAVPARVYDEEMEFEPPVELLEPLLFVLRRLIEQLARRLEMGYLVAAELDLLLGLCSGGVCQRLFVIPVPTCDVDTLFRILRTYLETVRTDSPIRSLRLAAKPGRPASFQFGLFDAALRDPNQFHETIARLVALLGNNRAGTPRLEDSHRPDDFRIEPDGLLAPRPDEPDATQLSGGPALRRFRPPLPATVETRSGRPALLRCPVFTGPIAGARGPWRLSGHWWDHRAWERDEWDVQTRDGGLFRLARHNEQWFVDGILD
jgi:protein ImuB